VSGLSVAVRRYARWITLCDMKDAAKLPTSDGDLPLEPLICTAVSR
jgi:hypothetical protein